MMSTIASLAPGRDLFLGLIALLSILGTAAPAIAQHEVVFQISDENGAPLPCRIHLKDADGKPVKAPGLPYFRDHFVCDGDVTVTVPTERYSYEIEHGPEFTRADGAGDVGNAGPVNVTLKRLSQIAAEGWHSGDLHVHRPIEEIPLLMRADDLDVAPVITWWNNRNLWADRALPAETLRASEGNSFFDVMAGEDEREGGALLFFGLKKPLEISKAAREYPSPIQFVNEARKAGDVWIDIEKPFWWDVPVWLAAGAADSIGIANNHMCRDSMYENEAWGRPRDTKRLPAPLGNGYWSQEIYYHILNCGIRLPPSAGSASGVLPNPVGYNRVYVHTDGPFTYAKWWEGMKAGRSFVTNGPLLVTKANGELPGHVFKGEAGKKLMISLEIVCKNYDSPTIEVIQNGEILTTFPSEPRRDGDVDYRSRVSRTNGVTFEKSGWLLIRAIDPNPRTFRFASTAPYYVEIGEEKNRISRKSAQFFLDWTDERIARVPNKLSDHAQLEEVLAYHKRAQEFWRKKVKAANAD